MEEVDLRHADAGEIWRTKPFDHRAGAVDGRCQSPRALREAAKGRRIGGERLEFDSLDSDGDADAVKGALRTSLALPDDVALMVGNGSDELLQIITTAVAKPGAAIIAPDPSFVMYRLYAVYANMRYVAVSLRDNFDLDGDAMLAAIERERPALIWLAYPNNPTGNLFDAATVERIIRAAPGLVVVDEAYYAFADRSFLPRVREFANLIVVRTVSKIGMAGLRLGYAATQLFLYLALTNPLLVFDPFGWFGETEMDRVAHFTAGNAQFVPLWLWLQVLVTVSVAAWA